MQLKWLYNTQMHTVYVHSKEYPKYVSMYSVILCKLSTMHIKSNQISNYYYSIHVQKQKKFCLCNSGFVLQT